MSYTHKDVRAGWVLGRAVDEAERGGEVRFDVFVWVVVHLQNQVLDACDASDWRKTVRGVSRAIVRRVSREETQA
jgi:hypothetical protein